MLNNGAAINRQLTGELGQLTWPLGELAFVAQSTFPHASHSGCAASYPESHAKSQRSGTTVVSIMEYSILEPTLLTKAYWAVKGGPSKWHQAIASLLSWEALGTPMQPNLAGCLYLAPGDVVVIVA